MGLFIVRHRHEPERCPATDPYMGAMLLNYVSRPNVRRHGVNIQGEAVVQGEHTLYMIIESSDEDRVRASATGTTPSRRCRFTSGSVPTRRGRPKPVGEEVDGRQEGTWSGSVTFSRPPTCARADSHPPATP